MAKQYPKTMRVQDSLTVNHLEQELQRSFTVSHLKHELAQGQGTNQGQSSAQSAQLQSQNLIQTGQSESQKKG